MEVGQTGGNYADKYNSKNPIVNYLMNGFLSSFDACLDDIPHASRAFDVGCGEGELAWRMANRGILVSGCDIDNDTVNEAQKCFEARNLKGAFFESDLVDLSKDHVGKADLVVCCEVLEHLDDPVVGLEKLYEISDKYLIASVPREPIWCAMNMARGKYWSRLGNTPGHVQHWSSHQFVRFISSKFKVKKRLNPLPWTMLLCEK